MRNYESGKSQIPAQPYPSPLWRLTLLNFYLISVLLNYFTKASSKQEVLFHNAESLYKFHLFSLTKANQMDGENLFLLKILLGDIAKILSAIQCNFYTISRRKYPETSPRYLVLCKINQHQLLSNKSYNLRSNYISNLTGTC